jgi:hypothetical protein
MSDSTTLSRDLKAGTKDNDILPESSLSYQDPKAGLCGDISEVPAAEDVGTQPLHPEKLMASPHGSITALSPSSLQKSIAASGQGTTPDLNPPPAEFEYRRKALLTDIAAFVKLQDRVTFLHVQAQEKRMALKHSRDLVAEQYSKIWDVLQECQNAGRPLDLQQLAPLRDELEIARNELGPAEEEFSNFEIQLVNEEASLRRRGEQIKEQWQTFAGSDSDRPPDPIYSQHSDANDRGAVPVEIAFISSSSEEAFIEREELHRDSVGAENTSTKVFSWLSGLSSERMPFEKGASSALLTGTSMLEQPEGLAPPQVRDQETVYRDRPEPSINDENIRETGKPELYVKEIKQDLLELAKTKLILWSIWNQF